MFPQLGLLSSDPKSKEIYWQCICCFFASSRVQNPDDRHIFFTNTTLPVVDGVSVSEVLQALSVEIVNLPITYRITRPDIKSWGNQFYILDIIKYLSLDQTSDRYMVLDSDCVWIKPVASMAVALDSAGVLTYDLGKNSYSDDDLINGCSKSDMAKFLSSVSGVNKPPIDYCGGEIFAATSKELRVISGTIDKFWIPIRNGSDIKLKEEAHFLSVIYALNGYEVGTANAYIKRIWTTFSHRTTAPTDSDLTIWHLPSEKKSGFRRLFKLLPANLTDLDGLYAAGFEQRTYARLMGVPNRSPTKFVQDLVMKITEKFQAST